MVGGWGGAAFDTEGILLPNGRVSSFYLKLCSSSACTAETLCTSTPKPKGPPERKEHLSVRRHQTVAEVLACPRRVSHLPMCHECAAVTSPCPGLIPRGEGESSKESHTLIVPLLFWWFWYKRGCYPHAVQYVSRQCGYPSQRFQAVLHGGTLCVSLIPSVMQRLSCRQF